MKRKKNKSILCIYCVKRNATTKDHVPPKCFFSEPRPNNLITVPCCEKCNNFFGKDDEIVRNLITSFDTTEIHPSIQTQLADKRNRSLGRKESAFALQHLINSMQPVDCFSPGGIYLGSRPGFNLNQPAMNNFIRRITIALLYHEKQVILKNPIIDWRILNLNADDFNSMPDKIKSFISSRKIHRIGNGEFSYMGCYLPHIVDSLWIINFYDGIDLVTTLRRKS